MIHGHVKDTESSASASDPRGPGAAALQAAPGGPGATEPAAELLRRGPRASRSFGALVRRACAGRVRGRRRVVGWRC